MSLDYFFGLTDLGTGIIRDTWPYNASAGLGDFSPNSVGNFVSQIVSGNNLEDFSLYFTYTKQQSPANSGGVVLFSNYSGGSGFFLGLDANNIPFLKTRSECFSFDSFELGGKNCLCFQKSNNSFSLMRYDIPSAQIREIQSFFVQPSVPLSGGSYTFGGSLDIVSGVNNFYGSVDQLLFLSERVSVESSQTIFSGFSALTAYNNPFGEYVVVSSEWSIPNTGVFGTGLRAIMQDYFTGVYQDLVIDEALAVDSEYVSLITFDPFADPPNHEVINYYGMYSGGFCQNASATNQMGDVLYIDFDGVLPTGVFNINGNFTISPIDVDVSPFLASEMYFTYDLSAFYPGVRYSNLIKLMNFDDIVQSDNTGYYSGFEMKGIFAPKSSAVVLGSFGTSFVNVGNEAVFDSVAGAFQALSVGSGMPIYLNGLKETGFVFTGGVIDVIGYTESSADEIIYDNFSGLSLLSFSNSSSTTGDFFVGTSFVATGEFSFETLYRISNSDFYESHPYNLFHRKSWQETFAPDIFPNLDENWT